MVDNGDLERVYELRRRATGSQVQADAALDDAETMRYAVIEFEKHVQRARAELCAANDNARGVWGESKKGALIDLLATVESQLHVARQENNALRRAYSLLEAALYCEKEALMIQDAELVKYREPH